MRPVTQSCYDHWVGGARSDGVYTISRSGASSFKLWCDMTTAGGGWDLVSSMAGTSLQVGTVGCAAAVVGSELSCPAHLFGHPSPRCRNCKAGRLLLVCTAVVPLVPMCVCSVWCCPVPGPHRYLLWKHQPHHRQLCPGLWYGTLTVLLSSYQRLTCPIGPDATLFLEALRARQVMHGSCTRCVCKQPQAPCFIP